MSAEDGGNRARSEGENGAPLLAVVAHELRGPLDAVTLAVSLLERETKAQAQTSPRASLLFERLKRNLGLVSRLVSDLVEKSRLDSGVMSLHRRPVDVVEVVTDVVSSLDEMNRARLSLITQGRVVVSADGERLAQVVTNLVRNALQHGEGAATITVSNVGDRGALSIENAGYLAPRLEGRLFHPFSRGTDRGTGLGLGLYVVKQVVEAHGGDITVEAGGGRVAFTITLPAG